MASSPNLCLIPAGPPPNGHSNFVDPPSLAPTVIAITAIMIVWATVFVAARFCINFQRLGWSDYFVLVSLLMSISILCIMTTITRTYRHIWDVPACFFDATFARGIYVPAVLLNLGSFFAKASIFLLFFQIFSIKPYMRYAILLGLIFNFLLYGVGVAVATYYEIPRRGETWIDTLDGRSLKSLHWWQAQSALIIVLDFYIFALPLPTVIRLNMPVRKRIQVIAVFSLALIGIGASIASLVERIHITRSSDQTWISTKLSLCSAVELNVAIIVSSAPAFANFTRTIFSRLTTNTHSLRSLSSRTEPHHNDPESGKSTTGSIGRYGRLSEACNEKDVHDFIRSNNKNDRRKYVPRNTWQINGHAKIGQDAARTMLKHGGILRTLTVEQMIVPASPGGTLQMA